MHLKVFIFAALFFFQLATYSKILETEHWMCFHIPSFSPNTSMWNIRGTPLCIVFISGYWFTTLTICFLLDKYDKKNLMLLFEHLYRNSLWIRLSLSTKSNAFLESTNNCSYNLSWIYIFEPCVDRNKCCLTWMFFSS